jgi:hypothetical protein
MDMLIDLMARLAESSALRRMRSIWQRRALDQAASPSPIAKPVKKAAATSVPTSIPLPTTQPSNTRSLPPAMDLAALQAVIKEDVLKSDSPVEILIAAHEGDAYPEEGDISLAGPSSALGDALRILSPMVAVGLDGVSVEKLRAWLGRMSHNTQLTQGVCKHRDWVEIVALAILYTAGLYTGERIAAALNDFLLDTATDSCPLLRFQARSPEADSKRTLIDIAAREVRGICFLQLSQNGLWGPRTSEVEFKQSFDLTREQDEDLDLYLRFSGYSPAALTRRLSGEAEGWFRIKL